MKKMAAKRQKKKKKWAKNTVKKEFPHVTFALLIFWKKKA